MHSYSSEDAVSTTSLFQQPSVNDYAALKQRIKGQGLLEKQPAYYTYKILLTLMMFIAGLAFLFLIHNFWFQLLNAVYLAVVFAQIGFLGHDIGHRQVFSTLWKSNLVGLLCGDLIIGMSMDWWIEKHNSHHSHPNQTDLDPDLNLPGISFSKEEAQNRRKLERFIMQHQAMLFFPLLLLVALDMQRASISFLVKERGKHRLIEAGLMLIHFILPVGILLTQLGIWQTVVFVAIHQGVLGLILGSAFAPNHKGMPVLEKASSMDFLRRQVLTARNIKAGRLTDFWYGGLNYQIEHHLFPSMPRNKLGAAQCLVKNFCRERGISYEETSVAGSYVAILRNLHEVSTLVRQEEGHTGAS